MTTYHKILLACALLFLLFSLVYRIKEQSRMLGAAQLDILTLKTRLAIVEQKVGIQWQHPW